MREEKPLEDVTQSDTNLSKEKVSKAIKHAYKEAKDDELEIETEEEIYLLGFMPYGEVNGLVLSELGESFNLDRVKKLWLPKSEKANQLLVSDMQLLDEEKMKMVVKDIHPQYARKIEEIEK